MLLMLSVYMTLFVDFNRCLFSTGSFPFYQKPTTKDEPKLIIAKKQQLKDLATGVGKRGIHMPKLRFTSSNREQRKENTPRHQPTSKDDTKDKETTNPLNLVSFVLKLVKNLGTMAKRIPFLHREKVASKKEDKISKTHNTMIKALKYESAPRGMPIISQWKKNRDNSISGIISNAGSRPFAEGT